MNGGQDVQVSSDPSVFRRFWADRASFLLILVPYLAWVVLTRTHYSFSWNEVDVYTRGSDWLQDWRHIPGTRNMSVRAGPSDGWVMYDHVYAALLCLLNPGNSITVFHTLNMLAVIPLYAAAYEWMIRRGSGPWRALSAPAMIFLLPRLTGDIAPNPKDSVFAAAFFVTLTLISAWAGTWDQKPLPKVLVLGMALGACLCLRLAGLFIFPLWGFYEAAQYVEGRGPSGTPPTRENRKALAWVAPGVFLLSHAVLLVSWPYLRVHPLAHYLEVLKVANCFPWDDKVLYMGRMIPALHLPWHYLPVWFWITTPLSLMGLFLVGFARAFRRLRAEQDFLLAATVVLYLIHYLALRPVIYDGLRHYLFLLPVLGTLAAGAFWDLWDRWKSSWFRAALVVAVLADLGMVAVHMVRLHPYEYIYFNRWVGGGRGAFGRYETDYLGESLNEGMGFLRNWLPPGHWKVAGSTEQAQVQPYMDPGWTYVPLEKADFYLATTRWNAHLKVPGRPVVYVVKREDIPLLYVIWMGGRLNRREGPATATPLSIP